MRLSMIIATGVASLGLLQLQTAPAQADFSGVQNFTEWQDVQPPSRRADVNDDCNCSGTWTGEDGIRNGNYWREVEYLHSDGFSLVYFRQADDGTWRVFWKKRWVDYDGPDFTTYF